MQFGGKGDSLSGNAAPAQEICAPLVATYSEYSDWLAAIKSRLRLGPPKQMLAQTSGNWILPSTCPAEERTWTPSQPAPPLVPAQILPSTSQRMPSASPRLPLPNIILLNCFLLRSLAPSTSKT